MSIDLSLCSFWFLDLEWEWLPHYPSGRLKKKSSKYASYFQNLVCGRGSRFDSRFGVDGTHERPAENGTATNATGHNEVSA